MAQDNEHHGQQRANSAGASDPRHTEEFTEVSVDVDHDPAEVSYYEAFADPDAMLSRINALSAETDHARQRLADAHDHLAVEPADTTPTLCKAAVANSRRGLLCGVHT